MQTFTKAQSLETLNMLDVRDGDEIEFDEFEVVA